MATQLQACFSNHPRHLANGDIRLSASGPAIQDVSGANDARRPDAGLLWFYLGGDGRSVGRIEIAFPQIHGWFADRADQLPNGHRPD
jgi:hypothetical protein